MVNSTQTRYQFTAYCPVRTSEASRRHNLVDIALGLGENWWMHILQLLWRPDNNLHVAALSKRSHLETFCSLLSEPSPCYDIYANNKSRPGQSKAMQIEKNRTNMLIIKWKWRRLPHVRFGPSARSHVAEPSRLEFAYTHIWFQSVSFISLIVVPWDWYAKPK